MSQTALYSTPTATIRAIEWRFPSTLPAAAAATSGAPCPAIGRRSKPTRIGATTLSPLAELDRAIYQPHRDTIAAGARPACACGRVST